MSHQALVFYEPAGHFELISRPTPKPGPGEVLVKNVAVALNPVDYVVHHLGLWVDHYGYPATVGVDAAGEVVALGDGVEELKVGDRILYGKAGWSPNCMTFQEYCTAVAVLAIKIPESMTFEAAATMPIGSSTAAIGLYQEYRARGGLGLTAPWEEGGYKKYAGEAAVVISGSSSVGQYALQLLKASGFNPIITTASKHNEAYCKAAGATHVIDYHDVPYAELAAEIKKITTAPIRVIYDAASKPDSQKAAWDILAPDGKLALVLGVSALTSAGQAGEVGEDGKKVTSILGTANTPSNFEFGKKMAIGLTKMLETGEIKPNNYEILPRGLAGVAGGLTRVAKGVSGVKLVARLAETEGELSGTEELRDAVPKHISALRKLFPVGTLPQA